MKFDIEMYVLVRVKIPAIDARNRKQAKRRVRDHVNLADLVNQKAFRRDVVVIESDIAGYLVNRHDSVTEKHSRF